MANIVAIPARIGSTRLKNKLLLDLNGKPVIQHVIERVQRCDNLDAIMVATDSKKIAKIVEDVGAVVYISKEKHQSGSDRICEMLRASELDLRDHIVNVQADEVFIDPNLINQIFKNMNLKLKVVTAAFPITAEQSQDFNRVKVVTNVSGYAMYFSRYPIPYNTNNVKLMEETRQQQTYLQHVGIYGYKYSILNFFSNLKRPWVEQAEMLEQLRFLYSGVPVQVIIAGAGFNGIDTHEDLLEAHEILEKEKEDGRK